MKSSFKSLVIATTFAVFGFTSLSAQEMPQQKDRPRLTPEQLAEHKANEIASQLAFDDATASKFVATYTDYQKEVEAIRQSAPQPLKADSLRSDEETEQSIKAGFENQQKMLDLRKEYYEKYRKFLSPKQIERVYSLDREERNQPMRPRFQRENGKNGRLREMRR